MKKLFFLFLIPAIISFTGCGTNEKSDATKVPQGMMELDLSQYGMPMTMMVPDSTIGTLVVSAQSYGDVEIRVGDYFQLKIAPGGDLALRKSDLQADLLFKTTLIKEDPAMIIYKSDLPDGSKSFHHFYLLINNYEISDIGDSGEPLSEAVVNKMVEAAKTLKAKVKES